MARAQNTFYSGRLEIEEESIPSSLFLCFLRSKITAGVNITERNVFRRGHMPWLGYKHTHTNFIQGTLKIQEESIPS